MDEKRWSRHYNEQSKKIITYPPTFGRSSKRISSRGMQNFLSSSVEAASFSAVLMKANCWLESRVATPGAKPLDAMGINKSNERRVFMVNELS